MLKSETVKEAFRILSLAATKVAVGSQQWVHFVGAAGVLGWVLEENRVYIDNTEILLKELRKFLGDPVFIEGG